MLVNTHLITSVKFMLILNVLKIHNVIIFVLHKLYTDFNDEYSLLNAITIAIIISYYINSQNPFFYYKYLSHFSILILFNYNFNLCPIKQSYNNLISFKNNHLLDYFEINIYIKIISINRALYLTKTLSSVLLESHFSMK